MPLRRAIVLALLFAPLPALAQGYAPPVGMSDADALAEQVRRLGANPLDLDALLTAGELSVRVDDLNAAGAFFSRAEKIDPRNGRAKAGEGAILVRSERPAEALRFFAQAEALGLPPGRFTGERGLAYDLVGDPGRAQRDYRVALATRDEAETRRRLALSLANTGRQREALEQLAPLIAQNDRAAWRTRAFVLAMGGDAAGASRIAETMMPPGAAAGLAGFFAQLPRMAPLDRAFAVHFGELQASPQRLADARLAPREAPLPVAAEPVRVAAAAPAPADDRRRSRRDRRRDRERELAAVGRVPIAPAETPLPPPPAYQPPAAPTVAATTPVRDRPLSTGELASLQAAGNRSTGRAARGRAIPPPSIASAPTRALTPAEQASLAAATNRRDGARGSAASAVPIAPPPAVTAVTVFPPARPPVQVAASSPIVRAPVQAVAVPSPTRPSVQTATASPARAPVQIAAAEPLPPPGPLPSALPPAAAAIVRVPDAAPTPGFSTSPTAPAAETVPSATIPASSLPNPPGEAAAVTQPAVITAPEPRLESQVAGSTPLAPLVTPPVAPPAAVRTPAPRPAVGTRRIPRAQADAILARIVANLSIPASELEVAAPARPTAGRTRTAAEPEVAAPPPTAAERRAAERRTAATAKAAADKKAALAAKVEADRVAAEERRVARAEPARIWVQVAGGANEAGLPAAWRVMVGRAPALLTGRSAWTTPLRATNRVLTGPFRTDAEARAFVNQLGKTGVNAFTFTSEAGQRVTRLATK